MDICIKEEYMKKRTKAVLILTGVLFIWVMAGTCTSSGTGGSSTGQSLTYADTIAWDGEYDVVVVGFGAAGATAANYAAKAGASVLLVEKAPLGQEGGNSKVCGQLVVTIDSKEDGLTYYRQLAGQNKISDAVLNVWLDGLFNIVNTLKQDYGIPTVYSGRENPIVAPSIPEYPELQGSKTINLVTVTPQISNAALYNTLRKAVMDRNDKIDVWFEAPGKHLIQDPVSKTIIGVQVEKQGKLVNIRATNGVVLATGGFENNPQMRQDYLNLPRAAVAGGFYNTGDGIKMAMEAGADLWHMEVWEGVAGYGGSSFVVRESEHASLMVTPGNYNNGSLILADAAGYRFVQEDYWPRHGHVYKSGFWHHPTFPDKYYLVYDQAQKETFDRTGAVFERFQNQVVSAPTVEALAQRLNMPNLVQTITNFNGFAGTGVDLELGRAAASMKPLTRAPYYAIELMPLMLNTQGGPRRDEQARIIDVNGNPIPQLYSAGELGGVTANLYQGGGNMSECIVFGKIAGTNAATPKQALPPLNIRRAASSMVYGIGKNSGTNASGDVSLGDLFSQSDVIGSQGSQNYTTGPNEYIGIGSGGMGGDVIVKITMDGTRIAVIEVIKHSETPGIGDTAINSMPSAMIRAQSADVDSVSGATLTSGALIAAVKDALSKAR
jgi:succinate dehydrogenase/fumarate reductase flavoprotein subunit/uncharacterized protein with FMN-binding domain